LVFEEDSDDFSGPEVGWRFSPKKQWKPTKDPIDV